MNVPNYCPKCRSHKTEFIVKEYTTPEHPNSLITDWTCFNCGHRDANRMILVSKE